MDDVEERIEAFFEFVYKRQEIWHKRMFLKQAAPWTDDIVLRDYKFCNVYRELDGGTQAVCRYLKDAAVSSEAKLFNIVAYRFFNRRDTIEFLFGGLLDPENFNVKNYEKRFDYIKKQQNIFSNAYLVTARAYNPDYRPKDKHVQILLMLDDLRFRLGNILAELRRNPPQEGLRAIERNVPMAGPFLSGQILLDATYAGDIVPYTGNDFLVVGPGAHWGLNIIFGKKLSPAEADEKCRFLYGVQKKYFDGLKRSKGLDWQKVYWKNQEYSNVPYLCLHDIQNSLCEFRKYWRLKHGEKAKKRYFSPTD